MKIGIWFDSKQRYKKDRIPYRKKMQKNIDIVKSTLLWYKKCMIETGFLSYLSESGCTKIFAG